MPLEPHTSLEGPRLAGWTPRVRPLADHQLREEANVTVPMPNGTRRRAAACRPQESGRYPALVSWLAYPKYIQISGAPIFNNEQGW